MTRTRFFDALKSYHWVRGLLALLCCLLILFASFAPPVRAAVLVDDVLMYMIGGAMSAMGISFGSAAAYESGVSSFWSSIPEAYQRDFVQKSQRVTFLSGIGKQVVEWAADEWEKLCDSVVSFFGEDTTVTEIAPVIDNCFPIDQVVTPGMPGVAESLPFISLFNPSTVFYSDVTFDLVPSPYPGNPVDYLNYDITVTFSDGSSFVGTLYNNFLSIYNSYLDGTYSSILCPYFRTYQNSRYDILRVGLDYQYFINNRWYMSNVSFLESSTYFTPTEFYYPDGTGGALTTSTDPVSGYISVKAGSVDVVVSYPQDKGYSSEMVLWKMFSDVFKDNSAAAAPAIPISIDDVYYPAPAAAIPTAIPKTTVVPATMEQALALTAEEAAPAVLQPPAPVPPPPPELPDISLPTLIFTQKFPFCLPYDLAKAFSGLFDTPEAPKFVLPFKIGNVINEEVTIDLEKYTPLAMIVRWGLSVLMVIGLILVSRKLIGAE